MNIYIVDSFTNQAYKGNPAAVCLLDSVQDEKWMQNVAKEMNLSETAFLYPQEDGYSLRWFTPMVEVDLCGHATLASAHVLWETGVTHPELRFYTLSGVITARKNNDWIELNFPIEREEPCDPPSQLIEGLGVKPVYIGKNRLDYVVEVESEDIVKDLQPNYSLLKELGGRGVLVTSRSSQGEYDFVSRCFFPSLGVEEDPVTGSAHCGLAPYWQKKLHKNEFIALQASEREGVLKLTLVDDRILISGQAVMTLRGELV